MMAQDKKYDVIVIGNALVDILSTVDKSVVVNADGTPTEHMAPFGKMHKIDTPEIAEALYKRMGQTIEKSGGSGANTLANMALLGAPVSLIGKVADDKFGHQFAHDIRQLGIDFHTAPSKAPGAKTGHCMIFVADSDQEKGARTMNTYIGISDEVVEADIEHDHIADSKVVFSEGYMWDKPETKKAIRKAFKLAHETGGKTAFTLSAPFCVERSRDELLDLVRHDVDILFCNGAEAAALFPEVRGDVEKAIEQLKKLQERGGAQTIVVTRGEEGAVVLTPPDLITAPSGRININAERLPRKPADTTGAGDAFAAGFLYGQTHDMTLRKSAMLGGKLAADVIQHVGGRPESRPGKEPKRHLSALLSPGLA
jgi:sugar/nucleoside kinase (ribokinase family)